MASKVNESTAVIFHSKEQRVIHVIHGTRIHQRVKKWMKKQGITLETHDYYVTS